MAYQIEVKLYNRTGSSKILAGGSFTVNGKIRINCTVIKGSSGPFVGLPGRMGKDTKNEGQQKFYSDVFIVDEDLRKDIQDKVLEAYRNLESKPEKSSQKSEKKTTDNAGF